MKFGRAPTTKQTRPGMRQGCPIRRTGLLIDVPLTALIELKQAVREYWNDRPCGSGLTHAPRGSHAYYRRHRAGERTGSSRSSAHSPGSRSAAGCDVLEVGFGLGTDRSLRAGRRRITGVDLTDAAVAITTERLAEEELEGERARGGRRVASLRRRLVRPRLLVGRPPSHAGHGAGDRRGRPGSLDRRRGADHALQQPVVLRGRDLGARGCGGRVGRSRPGVRSRRTSNHRGPRPTAGRRSRRSSLRSAGSRSRRSRRPTTVASRDPSRRPFPDSAGTTSRARRP